jgi:hypothetical protein
VTENEPTDVQMSPYRCGCKTLMSHDVVPAIQPGEAVSLTKVDAESLYFELVS